MQVEQIPINRIKPYWRNPRHNDEAVAAVRESITRYGFNVPIVLDPKYVIIAGHTRYKASLELGLTQVPCVVVELDEAKAKEYRIADNKTSEMAGWNMDNLIPELREIDSLEDFQVFFNDIDLSNMFSEVDMDFSPPPDEEIQDHKEKTDTFFEEKVKDKIDSYVEVVCPECGHEFYVDRKEINRIRIPDSTNEKPI